MGFSDVEFSRITNIENSKKVGGRLLFPNWTNCIYRGNSCPKIIQKHRESGLVMKLCSNNDSIMECKMYQFLCVAFEKYDFLRNGCGYLAVVCGGASESIRKSVSQFYNEREVVCSEIVGESL